MMMTIDYDNFFVFDMACLVLIQRGDNDKDDEDDNDDGLWR